MRSITTGVRDLCAFVLRHGDLRRFAPPAADLTEMGAAHASVVSRRASEGCRTEVGLSRVVAGVAVRGRADVVVDTAGGPAIEEVKCVTRPLADLREPAGPDPAELLGLEPEHVGDRGGRTLDWAQAMCYAAMHEPAATRVTLRYVREGSVEELLLSRTWPAGWLERYFTTLAARYGVWVERATAWATRRDASLDGAVLPYDAPRPGQPEMMAAVAGAIATGERLVVRAPTGIGKTMAVLLPALRSLRERVLNRVFYLTPRGTAAEAVLDAVEHLRARGAAIRIIHLSAREKTCPLGGGACDPGGCVYARGHHDRILAALAQTLDHDTIDAARLQAMATRHRVCPHELGLDASEWCDLIVGDYNYVFDPRVALRRYQDWERPARDQVYLVDEAHQLVDRARQMYSAALSSADLETLARAVETGRPELAEASRALSASLPAAAQECDELAGSPEVGWSWSFPSAVAAPLTAVVEEGKAWLADWGGLSPPPEPAAVVFDLLFFEAIRERATRGYATILTAQDGGIRLELACLDPSYALRERLDFALSSIFFSATLTPPSHYARLLCGEGTEGAATMSLPSPFPRENLRVVVDTTLTNRYRERPVSAPKVARLVARVVACAPGPYLVFLPSYAYLERVVAAFERLGSAIPWMAQRPEMSPPDRDHLLAELRLGRPLAAFVVMGGLFAESVDLPGGELLGAVIAGTGLPPPTPLTQLIRAYHDERDGAGFERAYLYPGLSRVLQAAGRVIRGPADRGVVVLADARFAEAPYREHLPPEWVPLVTAQGVREVVASLEEFWVVPSPSRE